MAASGTFGRPRRPALPGLQEFTGQVLHAADYRSPTPFSGRRMVVGAGNSAVAPGSGCAARGGYNRSYAILGTSQACVATHPSDIAVVFAALEAHVHVLGANGQRQIPFADFLLRPGLTTNREQALKIGELITAVEIPALPRPLASGYLKVRDRQSYEFALTSAAVALHVRGGVIREAKVATRGVSTVPWKLPAVEQHLVGERPSPSVQCEYLPQELGFGSGMTCWRRLAAWNESGVWDQLHQLLLNELRSKNQLDWDRAVIDSSHVRAGRFPWQVGCDGWPRRKVR
ncbi:FAD binding domain-containing protein [Streptomyces flaveolus]